MTFQRNVSLRSYNTFAINQQSSWYCELHQESEFPAILEFLRNDPMPVLIVGGGSNLLLTKDFEGLVILNRLKGIEIVERSGDNVLVRAAAGEVWHDFVMFCIDKDLAGIENLSLIPGCVGAAPMQNIGAYGVEIKDTFHSLEALHMKTGEKRVFTLDECRFGYRESIFKNEVKGEYLITSVTFRLSTKPEFHTTYGAIQQELDKMKVQELTIRDVSNAVVNIRRSKLPDPAQIGNAGSFFKNPVVPRSIADQLLEQFPQMPVYPAGESHNKLAAGWLIEQAGWKGYTVEDRYGVHKLQALVLVHYHDASGREIYELSEKIIQSIKEKFGVTLEREVNIL